ncbi:anthranilate synthase [Dermacoccus sp. PE3]|uniref:anthranilate synthase component I n=1 Tax=Dermacoccus sp. PE3 TaxID=1641401 RepID=UPI0006425B42|nr:anthranilate synthase component I [Dermacoccus sp. PE3]KLO61869.1 anthranilate synthase [Dermacoccus sp. PE3]
MTTTPSLAADLTWGATWPSADVFTHLATERRVIPVVRRLLADAETPIGVYRKLARDEPGTFLLESAEHGGVWSRYSFIGAASRATLTERDGEVVWLGDVPTGLPTSGLAVDALRESLELLHTERIPGLPPLTSGLVGAIGYDAVRRWEKIGDDAEDALGIPEVTMLLATDLAVMDHQDGSLLLIANAVNFDGLDTGVEGAYVDAVARLDAMQQRLGDSAPSTVAVLHTPEQDVRSTHTREQFHDMVEACKEDIRAGEAFQIVVSQRFSVDTDADALDVYRALRASNPSPYMYLLRLPLPDGGVYDVVGSSPEALVKVTGERVITHPIAGSRPRGKTPEHDRELGDDLLNDPKERSEHLMLVDLSRNDLQRVCGAGTVETVEFMNIRNYSHVIHLESTVVGTKREDASAYDVLEATFPAGTLSGAPKPRAMQIIESREGSRRGVYGGVIGYFDFAGDADAAIAIRTAVLKDGVAHVQAGAGVVADSVPESEYQETINKAAAALRAVATATGMEPIR